MIGATGELGRRIARWFGECLGFVLFPPLLAAVLAAVLMVPVILIELVMCRLGRRPFRWPHHDWRAPVGAR